MSDSGNGSNSVAIVGIIAVTVLILAGGYMYFNQEPKVVEKTTVVEKEAPKKEEPGFSFEFKDDEGNSATIEGDN